MVNLKVERKRLLDEQEKFERVVSRLMDAVKASLTVNGERKPLKAVS
jgi:hypothetical protein